MSKTTTLSAVVRDGVNRIVEDVGDPRTDGADRYLAAVSLLLAELLPGDLIAWNRVHLPSRQAKVQSSDPSSRLDPSFGEALARLGLDNPMVHSYLGSSGGLEPRRLSDLVSARELRRTRSYAELYKPMGAHAQLTILTSTNNDRSEGRCWGINRSAGDFTDREMDIATALQPALSLLDRAFDAPALTPAADEPHTASLTARELSILRLLAKGLTARQISTLLSISPATVRKHLEHTYAKLGTHDRMLAVNHARTLGYL